MKQGVKPPSKVTLSLFGQTYHLKADDNEVNMVELVQYVEEKEAALARENPDLPQHKMAVLLLLNVARDMFLVRRNMASMVKGTREEARRLEDMIDQALDGGGAG